jgi:hypothetical protein
MKNCLFPNFLNFRSPYLSGVLLCSGVCRLKVWKSVYGLVRLLTWRCIAWISKKPVLQMSDILSVIYNRRITYQVMIPMNECPHWRVRFTLPELWLSQVTPSCVTSLAPNVGLQSSLKQTQCLETAAAPNVRAKWSELIYCAYNFLRASVLLAVLIDLIGLQSLKLSLYANVERETFNGKCKSH